MHSVTVLQAVLYERDTFSRRPIDDGAGGRNQLLNTTRVIAMVVRD
jgi:hypothetical protein